MEFLLSGLMIIQVAFGTWILLCIERRLPQEPVEPAPVFASDAIQTCRLCDYMPKHGDELYQTRWGHGVCQHCVNEIVAGDA